MYEIKTSFKGKYTTYLVGSGWYGFMTLLRDLCETPTVHTNTNEHQHVTLNSWIVTSQKLKKTF